MTRSLGSDLLAIVQAREAVRSSSRSHKVLDRGALRMAWPQVVRCFPALGRIPYRAELITGEGILVSLPDDVSVSLYRYGYFEADVLAFALTMLQAGDVVIDVGSHVGSFALICSRVVGPTGRILAFEPTPRTFELLATNCNEHKTIDCFPLAISDRDERLELTDFGPSGAAYNRIGRSNTRSNRRLKIHAQIDVAATTLDSLLSDYPRVDLIKVDVEDAELPAVVGGRSLIVRDEPTIILEVGDAGVDGKSRRVLDFLQSLVPYEMYEWNAHSGKIVPHTLRSAYGYGNILLTTRVTGLRS